MVSKAIARFARLSPRKARVMVNLVRGRQAGEALQILEFTKKAGAPVLKKLIESAVANARTTFAITICPFGGGGLLTGLAP